VLGRVPVRLAIVGAGPSCTYAIERLAARAGTLDPRVHLAIHVYDKSGHFGAGHVHSATQPATSFLNRIAGQVAFAADESVAGAGSLLPTALRPTLHEWCRLRFAETGDAAFNLAPEDWPKRYMHGLALQSQFARYVEILRAHPQVLVDLHADEVVDLVEAADGFQVITAHAGKPPLVAHQVLMVTGHSVNDPKRVPVRRDWVRFAANRYVAFIPSAYPLEEHLTDGVAAAGRTVGCAGMGLTAIDVILYLTEGRGGRFEQVPGGRPRYVASGTEPRSIVAFGAAGLFTFARPYNAKESSPATLEHTGVFLTRDAVDRLRENVGRPVRIGPVLRRQLDFETHVFPLVELEMAYLYYATLLGPGFGTLLVSRASAAYERFLQAGDGELTATQARATLLTPVEAAVDEAATMIDGILGGTVHISDVASLAWAGDALRRYVGVVFGPGQLASIEPLLADPPRLAKHIMAARSPWGHAIRLSGNRFSWEKSIQPIPRVRWDSPGEYQRAVVGFMVRDHLWAAQNNVDNPAKAAADGVWRDLRPVLGHAVDFGGLNAASHQVFLNVYLRHHNRLANGAGLQVMNKILALVEAGLVDVSIGPDARVEMTGEVFEVVGPWTGARRQVDVLVDARVHPFDPAVDTAPVYPAILRRGLVRKWRNPDPASGLGFEPGGLDLTPDFHPIRRDGVVEKRVTFLGPASEGVMFFQLGALRPNQNHHVMQDILCWIDDFWQQIGQLATQSGGHATARTDPPGRPQPDLTGVK
jgi:hypothetical protein